MVTGSADIIGSLERRGVTVGAAINAFGSVIGGKDKYERRQPKGTRSWRLGFAGGGQRAVRQKDGLKGVTGGA